MNRDLDLKETILLWLLKNENTWNRINSCIDFFRNYIYDDKGNYLIGGKNVSIFIEKADKLIYGGIENE